MQDLDKFNEFFIDKEEDFIIRIQALDDSFEREKDNQDVKSSISCGKPMQTFMVHLSCESSRQESCPSPSLHAFNLQPHLQEAEGKRGACIFCAFLKSSS